MMDLLFIGVTIAAYVVTRLIMSMCDRLSRQTAEDA